MGSREYATVQIDKNVKQDIVNYCNKKGLLIGRFVETLFTDFVSGSSTPRPFAHMSGSMHV